MSAHRLRRLFRRAALILACAVFLGWVAGAALAAAAALSSSILLWTSWGHARVCELVSSQVSAAIAGKLEIDGIDEIALPIVKAHGIRLLDPDGVAAIEVESVELEVDLSALADGRLLWRRASIDRGTVRLSKNAEGRLNMEQTFRSKEVEPAAASPPPGDGADGSKVVLDLRSLSTSHMKLLIGGGGLPALRIVGIRGVMGIRARSDGKVELRFDGYRGSVVEGLPTGRFDFREVQGFVQSDDDQLLRFEGPGESEGEPVEFVLDIFTEPHEGVQIDAYFPKASLESLATLAFSAYTKFSKNLDLRVHHGAR